MAKGTRVEMKLEGGEELLELLSKLDLNVKSVLSAATRAGAQIIEDDAKGMAPGPHIEMEVTKATENMVEVAIGPDAEHWYYRFYETGAAPHEIHGKALLAFEGSNGTVITPSVSHPGMGAKPFLRPAHDANHSTAKDGMGAKLKEKIDQTR